MAEKSTKQHANDLHLAPDTNISISSFNFYGLDDLSGVSNQQCFIKIIQKNFERKR